MAVFLSRSYFGRDFNLAVVQQRITFQVEAQIPKLSSLNDIIKIKSLLVEFTILEFLLMRH